jgi:hypothetical protein
MSALVPRLRGEGGRARRGQSQQVGTFATIAASFQWFTWHAQQSEVDETQDGSIMVLGIFVIGRQCDVFLERPNYKNPKTPYYFPCSQGVKFDPARSRSG